MNMICRSPAMLPVGFAAALAFTFSFAISGANSVPAAPKLLVRAASSPRPPFSSSCTPPCVPTASDLLDLLGSPQDAGKVQNPEAGELRSCFRFLVPFSPSASSPGSRRAILAAGGDGRGANEMVWWPPAPVMELARLSVDSGGDPAEITRTLDPTMIPVHHVEGSKEDKCELTRTPYWRRFVNKELNSYLAFLFKLIAARGPVAGFNVTLNRYDLFHGHIFLAYGTGRLGILFHAKEYPAYAKEDFPYNLGYCQKGSNVEYDDSINLRNILWLAPFPSKTTKAWLAPGVLVALDAHPEGIIYKKLVPDYVDDVRTIYEDEFGEVVADVNYLNVHSSDPSDKIFIC